MKTRRLDGIVSNSIMIQEEPSHCHSHHKGNEYKHSNRGEYNYSSILPDRVQYICLVLQWFYQSLRNVNLIYGRTAFSQFGNSKLSFKSQVEGGHFSGLLKEYLTIGVILQSGSIRIEIRDRSAEYAREGN